MADQAAGDIAPVIVGLPGEIDVANVGHVYDLLSAALDTGARVIVADLTGTEFCDAAGVRLLVMVRGQAAVRDAQLRLVIAPGALLRRLLVLLRADHLLPVYATAAGGVPGRSRCRSTRCSVPGRRRRGGRERRLSRPPPAAPGRRPGRRSRRGRSSR